MFVFFGATGQTGSVVADMFAVAKNIGAAYVEAIARSGVQKVVLLSSVGSQHASGTGNIMTTHFLENIFGDLEIPVTFLRAAGFMENWNGVAAVGVGVENFKQGDAVYGMTASSLSGGYAEYALAGVDTIAPKPESLDFENAASLPIAALTAWQAMFDVANLSSGQSILIAGASGGVGSMAVQLAKAKGAIVIGTASGKNEQFVRDLSADEFVDYTAQPFEEVVKNVDVVFDTIGGDTCERSKL